LRHSIVHKAYLSQVTPIRSSPEDEVETPGEALFPTGHAKQVLPWNAQPIFHDMND
jgi:hypothetical protein